MAGERFVGRLEFEILLQLARGPSHGYPLMEAIAAATNGRTRAGPGSLYVAIKRLMEMGLLEEVPTKENGGGPARRTYRITRRGRSDLRTELERMRKIVEEAVDTGWIGSSPKGRA